VQLGGIVTLFGLGGFMIVNFKRDLKKDEEDLRKYSRSNHDRMA